VRGNEGSHEGTERQDRELLSPDVVERLRDELRPESAALEAGIDLGACETLGDGDRRVAQRRRSRAVRPAHRASKRISVPKQARKERNMRTTTGATGFAEPAEMQGLFGN
jgi:hypothetical protein